MKIFISLSLILIFAVNSFATWHNGPPAEDINHPFFGGHDWIAWKAYELAKKDSDLDFIKDNEYIFFYGTEAPDAPILPGINPIGKYDDQRQCHCIRFDADGKITRDRAALRAMQEFTKAQAALVRGDKKMAAFYAGAMAHYIGDLGQFMHLMGGWSHWKPDSGSVHSQYEAVLDKLLDIKLRKSDYLERFIKSKKVNGDNAREITINVARFVETGGGTKYTPGWMYDEYVSYISERGKRGIPTKWSAEFLNQTGANVNEAVNGIAKLFAMLGDE